MSIEREVFRRRAGAVLKSLRLKQPSILSVTPLNPDTPKHWEDFLPGFEIEFQGPTKRHILYLGLFSIKPHQEYVLKESSALTAVLPLGQIGPDGKAAARWLGAHWGRVAPKSSFAVETNPKSGDVFLCKLVPAGDFRKEIPLAIKEIMRKGPALIDKAEKILS
jgi:hypothetical protein